MDRTERMVCRANKARRVLTEWMANPDPPAIQVQWVRLANGVPKVHRDSKGRLEKVVLLDSQAWTAGTEPMASQSQSSSS